MESSEVVKIRVENIYPHPDNPRKDLGDVTELAESMKKHGVMQNLTVIPASALTADPEDQPDADKVSVISDFHALIGHRRLEAAKLAGLDVSVSRFFSGQNVVGRDVQKPGDVCDVFGWRQSVSSLPGRVGRLVNAKKFAQCIRRLFPLFENCFDSVDCFHVAPP